MGAAAGQERARKKHNVCLRQKVALAAVAELAMIIFTINPALCKTKSKLVSEKLQW
jgi:hypothetical protein